MLYTYTCKQHGDFEHSSSLAEYTPKVKCIKCRKMCERNLEKDWGTVVPIGDATPKTLGSLAEKNADKYTDDQKKDMKAKQNHYKYNKPDKPLPKGMTRVKRPKEKTEWV